MPDRSRQAPVAPRRAVAPGARVLAAAVLVLLGAGALAAQDAPWNMTERGRFHEVAGKYADVWGDGTTAYLAHEEQDTVDIIDIQDPDNPQRVAIYSVPAPDVGASAQDVKVHDGLLFIALEGSTANAALIVDVRVPSAPSLLTRINLGAAHNQVHNVTYDGGWLYLVDSDTTDIHIVDLRAYDPDAAPATISSAAWVIQGVGNVFVHDITVHDGLMFAAAWNRLAVFDVSDLATTAPVQVGMVPGDAIHSSWVTDDGAYLVVGEEKTGGRLLLYEIVDGGGSVALQLLDTFSLPNSVTTGPHNPVLSGDFIYSSFFQAGVQVLHLDRAARRMVPVASFDTSVALPPPPPSDGPPPPPHEEDPLYSGAWGVYPLLGADRILVSDMQEGLFVLQTDTLASHLTTEPALLINHGQPAPVGVHIEAEGAALDPASVELVVSIDGGPLLTATMTDLGGGDFTGSLPTLRCGDVVWWVAAENTAAMPFTLPADVPADAFTSIVVTGQASVLVDDFEADQGWTVSNLNLLSGAWERGDPIGTGVQPEDDNPGGTGTLCYFTGQGLPGGAPQAADVDGGPTILTSPPLDVSLGDGLISWAYWFSTEDGNDALDVELSADGSVWVPVTSYTEVSSAWAQDGLRVSDYVTPGPAVRVRFLVSDDPNDSVTEAAIDDVSVLAFECVELWDDVGGGTTGVAGVPKLVMNGPQTAGSVVSANLTKAAPGAIMLLWISLSSAPVPLFGGTLHAFPFSDEFLLFANGGGAFSGAASWSPGVPPGTNAWWQFLCQDGSVPWGVTLSNAVKSTSP